VLKRDQNVNSQDQLQEMDVYTEKREYVKEHTTELHLNAIWQLNHPSNPSIEKVSTTLHLENF